MKKLFKRVSYLIIPAMLLPMAVFAQQNINGLLQLVIQTLNYILVILFILLTLYFVWGIVQYVTSGGDEEKLAKGKQHMLWGIIGMAVAAGAWGIVQIILSYIGVTGAGTVRSWIPQF